jgi:hypothetical protein
MGGRGSRPPTPALGGRERIDGMQYVVTWAIDVEADNPVDAAWEAFRILSKPRDPADPDAAVVFDTLDADGRGVRVDLAEHARP